MHGIAVGVADPHPPGDDAQSRTRREIPRWRLEPAAKPPVVGNAAAPVRLIDLDRVYTEYIQPPLAPRWRGMDSHGHVAGLVIARQSVAMASHDPTFEGWRTARMTTPT
jgi:hypothetical protein